MTTTISNSKIMAAIRHKGAELVSLQSVATQKEYIWVGNPNFWGKHSPILFPIVGTLKHNSFTYKDKTYALSRHGFARDRVFELVSQSEHELVFSLLSDEESWAVYPFAFELQVVYTIKESELRISYKVFNKGSEVMYYAIGGHPALALPNTFEDYNLLFEPNETLVCYTLENDLLSDKTKNIALHDTKLPLTYSLFEHDALIFMSFLSKQIQLLENNTPILNFKFKDFPNFGIWTKVGAPFICLEPWAGYSDVLDASGRIEDKEGIQLLAVDSSKAYQFSIEIL